MSLPPCHLGHCVNCRRFSDEDSADHQQQQEMIYEFQVDTQYDDDPLKLPTKTVTVQEVLSSIYKLEYVEELNFLDVKYTSSSSSHHNNDEKDEEEEEKIGVCQTCYPVLVQLFKVFNQFNALRVFDSYLSKKLVKMDDLIHRLQNSDEWEDDMVKIEDGMVKIECEEESDSCETADQDSEMSNSMEFDEDHRPSSSSHHVVREEKEDNNHRGSADKLTKDDRNVEVTEVAAAAAATTTTRKTSDRKNKRAKLDDNNDPHSTPTIYLDDSDNEYPDKVQNTSSETTTATSVPSAESNAVKAPPIVPAIAPSRPGNTVFLICRNLSVPLLPSSSSSTTTVQKNLVPILPASSTGTTRKLLVLSSPSTATTVQNKSVGILSAPSKKRKIQKTSVPVLSASRTTTQKKVVPILPALSSSSSTTTPIQTRTLLLSSLPTTTTVQKNPIKPVLPYKVASLKVRPKVAPPAVVVEDTCPICQVSFKITPNLTRHLMKHIKPNNTCPIPTCAKAYDGRSAILEHIRRTHTRDRRHKCPVMACSRSFARMSEKREHLRTHWSGGTYICDMGLNCEKIFPSEALLYEHRDTGHPKILQKCPSCPNLNFETELQLKTHLKAVHNGVNQFKCHICSKALATKRGLDNHLEIHEENREVYRCERNCGYRFKTEQKAKEHSDRCTFDLYCCEVCAKTFRDKSYFNIHLKTHQNEEPTYKCDHKGCDKAYFNPSTLAKHRMMHSDNRPFVCHECAMSFHTATRLKNHLLVHSTEKPFLCTMCGKRFVREMGLKSHMSSHSETKQFPCAHCDKVFKFAASRHLHFVTVHKEGFSCHVCRARFPYNVTLQRHLASLHPEAERDHSVKI